MNSRVLLCQQCIDWKLTIVASWLDGEKAIGRRIDFIVFGYCRNHFLRTQTHPSAGAWYLVQLAESADASLDALQERFATQYPSLPGCLERIGWRIVDPGLQETAVRPSCGSTIKKG